LPLSFASLTASTASNTVEVPLSAGKHTINLAYYENGGHAVAGLTWEKIAGPEPDSDCAQFLEDIAIPDGTVVQADETFRKGWKLKNCGNTTWSWDEGQYWAVRVDGSMPPSWFLVPVVAPERATPCHGWHKKWHAVASPFEWFLRRSRE
jgi:hypothetical protein